MKKHKRSEAIELSDFQLFAIVGFVSLFIAAYCWMLFFLV